MPGERCLVTDPALAEFHEPRPLARTRRLNPTGAGGPRTDTLRARFPLAGKSFADRGPGSAEFDG